MKIVINALSARLGGGQTYLINLLRHLPADMGVEIYIYAPDSLQLPADPRIVRLQTAWPANNPLARAVWEKLVLPRVLKKLKADILFCPGGLLSTPAPAGCRSVTMFRNMIPFDPAARQRIPYGLQRIRNWILERVMLGSMARADLVIFISEFARSVIQNRIRTRNAVTIPHGISPEFRASAANRVRPDFLPAGDYILYVSRFDVYKHHAEVVAAYHGLPSELKEQFRLILIGESNTACGEQVRDFIEAQGIAERVSIIGAVQYQLLPAVYRNAELVLFASSCENCPNILLEALASGRPVLSSSIMPMPEFGGDAVGYFDPRNTQEIGAAMLSVLTDRARRAELAERAALRSEQYSWEATAAKTWASIAAMPTC